MRVTFAASTEWMKTCEFAPLHAGDVQVWHVDIAARWLSAEACEALLSSAELERLARMREGTARDEFRVGRACLRALLGAALDCDPRAVEFKTGAHGKPEVAGIQFNVAHSRGLVLIALSREAKIGVDVEWIDEHIEALDIAEGGFAPEEIAAISAEQGGLMRALTFYRCWTRKEAVVKAHGQGLTLPLAGFAVSTEGIAEREVRMADALAGYAKSFYVRELEVGGGFVSALATDRPGLTVRRYQMEALPSGVRFSARQAFVASAAHSYR